MRHKRRGVKWIGRPVGSSGSWGNDERYQDWYRYGEIERESSRPSILVYLARHFRERWEESCRHWTQGRCRWCRAGRRGPVVRGRDSGAAAVPRRASVDRRRTRRRRDRPHHGRSDAPCTARRCHRPPRYTRCSVHVHTPTRRTTVIRHARYGAAQYGTRNVSAASRSET